MQDDNGRCTFAGAFLLLAIGMVGVDIFSGNKVPRQGIYSRLTFFMGGLSASLSFKVVSTPCNFIGMVLGNIIIIILFTGQTYIRIIGDGSTERWVAYPTVLWLTGLQGYFLNWSKQKGVP